MPRNPPAEKPPIRPRKAPVQSRSKRTLEWVLEGAARVFRSEGFGATTNRIAEAAGVSIGTLYDYFPNKQALLVALAERHVTEAEREVDAALHAQLPTPALLAALQRAVVASHRYPSQAIDLVADAAVSSALTARAGELRRRIMAVLVERASAAGRNDPALRARTVFGLIAELSSRSAYESGSSEQQARLARHVLDLAIAHLG
jgi:AcrR family transcriptional regulator